MSVKWPSNIIFWLLWQVRTPNNYNNYKQLRAVAGARKTQKWIYKKDIKKSWKHAYVCNCEYTYICVLRKTYKRWIHKLNSRKLAAVNVSRRRQSSAAFSLHTTRRRRPCNSIALSEWMNVWMGGAVGELTVGRLVGWTVICVWRLISQHLTKTF